MKPLILFCIIALFRVSPVVGGPTGSITGMVSPPAKSEARIPVEKYVGSISGKVVRPPVIVAGVWIEGPGLVAPSVPASVTMNQKGYQFGQSLQIVARGTKMLFPNEDDDYHNVFPWPGWRSLIWDATQRMNPPPPPIHLIPSD